jgi:hypothetical protein
MERVLETVQGGCAAKVMAALALAAAPLPALLPSGPPSFSEAWQQEVVQGNLAAAADLYQKIYEDSGSGPRRPGPPAEVRRRAAFRAGACFEKLGDHRRAGAAYGWLVRAGPPDDALARSAQVRLQDLAVERASPGDSAARAAPSPGPPEAPGPLQQVLERFRGRVEQREAALALLRAQAMQRAEAETEERFLLRRLQEMGVEVRLLVEGEAGPARPLSLDLPLEGEDQDLLFGELAERYYLRGLRALRDRDAARAVEELRKTVALRPGFLDAADLLRAASAVQEAMEGISERAALRLGERREARRLEEPQEIRAALASAERQLALGRAPSALLDLERARSLEEWAPQPVWRDPAMRSLAQEADLRLLGAALSLEEGRGGPLASPRAAPPAGRSGPPAGPAAAAGPSLASRYEELRARGRRAAAALLDAAEELMDREEAEGERRRAALFPWGPPEAARARRKEALFQVGEEMERLLLRGEERQRQRSPERSEEGWRRDFLHLLLLARWFPELDEKERYRKLALDYLSR